jgi:hypothetical protein
VLLAWGLLVSRYKPYELGSIHEPEIAAGEQLLRGLRLPGSGDFGGTMPAASTAAALVGRVLTPRSAALAGRLIEDSLLILVFVLGARLGGLAGGALSLLVLLVTPSLLSRSNFGQVLNALPVLVSLSALLERARRPTPVNGALAGLALGASLLFRSPLALLPPVYAVWELRSRPRRAREPLGLAALVLLPYLMLLPWLFANKLVEGRWSLFEAGRADMNLVLGSLGLVPNAEGDWRALAPDLPREAGQGSVLLWAARESLSHPWRTAAAFLGRLRYAFGFQPALFLLALASLWTFRRGRSFRVLALFLGYFLAVHCAMTLAVNYLIPFWPPLALAACSRLAWPLTRTRRAGRLSPRTAAALRLAALALVAGHAAYAINLTAAFPGRLARKPADAELAVAQALAKNPADAGLALWLAQAKLAKGEREEAAALFDRALALRPDELEPRLYAAWSRALAGRPAALLGMELGERAESDDRVRLEVMRGWIHLREGRAEKARGAFAKAESLWKEKGLLVARESTELERGVRAALKPSPELGELLRRPLEQLPAKERARLLDALIAAVRPPAFADDLRAMRRGLDAGTRPAAASAAGAATPATPAAAAPARSAASPVSFERSLERAAAELQAGRAKASLAALGPTPGGEAQPPKERARHALARAAALAGLGRWKQAEAAAAEADALSPGSGEAALLRARCLLQDGRPARAVEVLAGVPEAARTPADRAARLAVRASARLAAKDDKAKEELNQALEQDAPSACENVTGDPRALLEGGFYDACAARLPEPAAALVDRGVARSLSGDAAGAEADFREALRRSPGRLEAAVSLAYLLEGEGKTAEALAALEASLAAAAGRSGEPVFTAAAEARARLKGKAR